MGGGGQLLQGLVLLHQLLRLWLRPAGGWRGKGQDLQSPIPSCLTSDTALLTVCSWAGAAVTAVTAVTAAKLQAQSLMQGSLASRLLHGLLGDATFSKDSELKTILTIPRLDMGMVCQDCKDSRFQ